MPHHLHLIAAALGIARGSGCACALCGRSPFGSAGSRSGVLGPGFVDVALLADPSARDVCLGCQRVLAGRPGDDPPPLRTRSIVLSAGELALGRASILWPAISDPATVAAPAVLSWAIGGKVHHALRAGVSGPERLLVGSDRGTIEIVPGRDAPLVEAVRSLLRSPTGARPVLARASVVSGHYHPAATEQFGAAEWHEIERVVARWRPGLLLELVVAACPLTVPMEHQEVPVIDPHDQAAADLLYLVVRRCALRSRDGVAFWGGALRHRIERARTLPLHDMLARLMDSLGTTTLGTTELVAALVSMTDEQRARIERALRERTSLIVALCYERVRAARIKTAASARREEPSLYA
jgi:hypothetical protein